MHVAGTQRAVGQQRVVGLLYDNQYVASGIFRGDIPGSFGAVIPAADAEALALAERVEHQSVMAPELHTVGSFDGTGLGRDIAIEEFREVAITDKADPGAVALVMSHKTLLACNCPHL